MRVVLMDERVAVMLVLGNQLAHQRDARADVRDNNVGMKSRQREPHKAAKVRAKRTQCTIACLSSKPRTKCASPGCKVVIPQCIVRFRCQRMTITWYQAIKTSEMLRRMRKRVRIGDPCSQSTVPSGQLCTFECKYIYDGDGQSSGRHLVFTHFQQAADLFQRCNPPHIQILQKPYCVCELCLTWSHIIFNKQLHGGPPEPTTSAIPARTASSSSRMAASSSKHSLWIATDW